MLVGYVITNLYRKEERKEKERRINKRPIDKQSAEEIFRNLQKTLNLPETGGTYRTTSSPTTTPTAQRNVSEGLKSYQSLKKQMVRLSEQRIKPHYSNLGKRKPRKPMEANLETIEPNSEGPSIDIDIRQAIIYSEILKRPQY